MTTAPSQLPSQTARPCLRRGDRTSSRPVQAPAAARRMVMVSMKRHPRKASPPTNSQWGGSRRASSSTSVSSRSRGSR